MQYAKRESQGVIAMSRNAQIALSHWSWILTLVAALFSMQVAGAASADNAYKQVFPQSRIVSPVNDNVRVTLAGNRFPLAIAANDMGPADDGLRFEQMILSLKPGATQTVALNRFLVAAHDRLSTQSNRWMTPQDFEQHFGVAANDLTKITTWLTAQGFTINDIPPGNRAIIFSGTVAQVRAAFHTEIHRYLVNGKYRLSNASDPQIPAALASVVDGVVSLNNFHSQPLHTRAALAPDYTAGGAHYLAAADFQTIYNLKPLYAGGINGNGKSIAILGRSNVVVSDIQQFRTSMNLPANTPQIIINGSDPGLVAGDQGESDLDLEWAGAVAPAATIKFITSASTTSTDGIDLSAQYAVSNNVADVISLSYGQCESSLGTTALNYINNLWQQAAALGITVLVSSGDSGAAGCDTASANSATQGRGINGLCSSPYSTCVGGTQFSDTANPSQYWSSTTNPTDQSSVLSYIPEVVWNESAANGGTGLWSTGGGASIRFAKPTWQTTPGVPADGKRDVPDVALTAATHDGYLVYSSDNSTQTQTLYVFGGTSASAPAFAGIVALVNQKTGYRQGNANPTLYGLASRQASNGTPAYFHTVTSGNNSVPGVTGFTASTSTPYFNQATGLGSVDAAVLVNHWTDLLPASSTALTVSPNPGTSGQNVTFTATVTGVAPTGTVQFADGATKLGSPIALNGGVATLATSALAPGSHSMTATYSGDSGNQPSISSPSVLAVMSTTTVALSAAPTSIAAGQSITFTATVSGTTPTGNVQFTDGGTNLGTPVVLSSGVATLTTTTLSAGTHNIAAIYSGDAYNQGSTSAAMALTVSAGSTGTGTATGDAPTLPEWAALLLGLMLMLTVWQRPLARR